VRRNEAGRDEGALGVDLRFRRNSGRPVARLDADDLAEIVDRKPAYERLVLTGAMVISMALRTRSTASIIRDIPCPNSWS
jgi:hypothetical protein